MPNKKRIAMLTGGGDCPGLNAVIRAVAKKAIIDYNMEVIGIEDGYEGLIHNRHRVLEFKDVSGIINMGGTILGTSNVANPYKYYVKNGSKGEYKNVSADVIKNLKKLGVECLVAIGGDGTLNIARELSRSGINVVGIPKTIDNDIHGTDVTFGFNTAYSIAADGIDRLHTTAQSHHRVMILEVMGRKAGWLALYSGLAGGGDVILLPEIPYDIYKISDFVKGRNKRGKRFSIIVVSEGAKPVGGKETVRKVVKDGSEPNRLGGVGFAVEAEIEKITGIEARTVVMGHLMRGGAPTPYDRVLCTQLGALAIELVAKKEYGNMVGVKGSGFEKVSLEIAGQGPRLVPLDHVMIKTALSMGTCFGN